MEKAVRAASGVKLNCLRCRNIFFKVLKKKKKEREKFSRFALENQSRWTSHSLRNSHLRKILLRAILEGFYSQMYSHP